MSNIDWSKAPEGYPIWLEDIRPHREGSDRSGWAREGKGEYDYPGGGYWSFSMRDVQYIAHKRPEWTGEGLPPAGTELEAGFACEDFAIWHKGVCVAVGEDPEGREEFCVVKFGNKIAMYRDEGRRMRPIRTPEQIAADKRLHEIRNALTAINSKVHFPNDLVRGNILAAAVEAMIDAGYRKQEAK
jgi:hypothetical protein